MLEEIKGWQKNPKIQEEALVFGVLCKECKYFCLMSPLYSSGLSHVFVRLGIV